MVRRPAARRRIPIEVEWRAAAAQTGGRYEPARGRRTGRIVVQDGAWRIEVASQVVQVGASPVTVTRSQALAPGRSGFRFTVKRRGLLSGLAAAVGLGGVRLGDPRLDRALVVRSGQGDRIRALVRDRAVSEPISSDGLRLRFGRAPWRDRRRLGSDTRMVQVEADGLVTEASRLVAMVTLTRTVLARLANVGAVVVGRSLEA